MLVQEGEVGEPRSLGSRIAANQNSSISVHTALLPSIRQGRGKGGLENDRTMGFVPK